MNNLYDKLNENVQEKLLHPYSEILCLIDDIENIKDIDKSEFEETMRDIYCDHEEEIIKEYINEDLNELDRLIKLNIKSVEEFLKEANVNLEEIELNSYLAKY